MEIQYLTNLKNNPIIYEDRIQGISEEQIANYEEKLGVTFPLVYKEFLFLGGKYAGELYLLEGPASIKDLTNPEIQKQFNRDLTVFNINIERPHWVFSIGSQAFYFFYLDEDTEDPKVYIVQYEGEGEHDIKASAFRFSQFINETVDYSIQYYKESYG